MRSLAIASIVSLVAFGKSLPSAAAEHGSSATRTKAEAAFMKSVQLQNTANAVTSDLLDYSGTRVVMRCTIEQIVAKDVMIGQCGKDVEPVDLYLEAATAHRRRGDILRVLGTVDPPIGWTDVWGHTIYYPFVRARFVDVIGFTANPDE